MAKREYVAEDVDFKGIETAFTRIDPPKLGLEEVLDRLRPKMLEHRKRGVTVEQLGEALAEKGIKVSARELRHFLNKGELPGGRLKKGSRGEGEAEPLQGARAGESGEGERRASVPAAG